MENYSWEASALRPSGWCQIAQGGESTHEYELRDPEQRPGVRAQDSAAPRPRGLSGADPSPKAGPPAPARPRPATAKVRRVGVRDPPQPAGGAPGLGGHSQSLELERQSSPPRLQGERRGRGEQHHPPRANEAH